MNKPVVKAVFPKINRETKRLRKPFFNVVEIYEQVCIVNLYGFFVRLTKEPLKSMGSFSIS